MLKYLFTQLKLAIVVAAVTTLAFYYTPVFAAEGDLWLELNGASVHGDSDYRDGTQRRYGDLSELADHPDCCRPSDDLTRLYVNEPKYRDYNSTNLGLGLKYGINDYVDVFGGFFENSYYKTSFYGGVNVKKDFYPGDGKFRVAPGLKLGLTSGYEGTPDDDTTWGPGGTTPLAIPNIEVGYDRYYINTGFIPAVGNQSTWVIMLQGGIRLDFFK